MGISKRKKIIIDNNSIFVFLMKTAVVFFFLFEINCSVFGLPTYITTRRLAVLVMLIHTFFVHGKIYRDTTANNRSFVVMVIFQFFILIYAAMLMFVIGRGKGENVFDSILRFLFIIIIGTYAMSHYFKNLDEMMKVILAATLIQAAIIILFAFVPGIQHTVNNFIGVDESVEALQTRGYHTGLACSAAPGVLRMIPGYAACIYFINKKGMSVYYVILYFTLVFCATIVARTALVLAAVGFVFIIVGNIRAKGAKGIGVIFVILFVFAAAYLMKYLFVNNDTLAALFNRLIDLYNDGAYNSFFATYLGKAKDSASVLPPISPKTMIGTGVTSGMSANNVFVNFDGGYARIYVALGLPLAIFMYLFTLINMVSATRKVEDTAVKYTLLFMIAYLFIGEFKEFFLYNGLALSIFYSILKLYYAERKTNLDIKVENKNEV
ncbi:MAG: hypothetical protein J5590_02890 [Clostridia bacterium]|nr:hypothetical protein [Clostridia bacterium]